MYIKKGEEMSEKELKAQVASVEHEGRISGKNDLTLVEAITMSAVTVLAVAVGTMYGTILF